MNTPSKSTEPGAPPAEGVIPLSIPELRSNEWQYLKNCVDTGWVSSVGAYVTRFEETVANYLGVPHTVAVVNGTAALHIALLIADIQPEDEVIMPALTFASPANAIRYVGAWPVFIDVESKYWQIDAQKLADFLQHECRIADGQLYNKHTGRHVTAILPVHLLGHPADLDAIDELARQYGLSIIEDAAEGLGATYKGRKLGNTDHVACLSFNGNKIITTGGGGMIVTANEAWARRAKYLTTQAKDDPLEYYHAEIGYNYRLTNIQAAIGCAQMEVLDEYVAAKRRIAATYDVAFANLPGLMTPREATWATSTFWLYTILIDAETAGLDSRTLLRELQEANIQSRPLWHPLHRLPPFKEAFAYHVEVAETLYRDALSLPCSVGLTAAQQQRVIEKVTASLSAKKRGA